MTPSTTAPVQSLQLFKLHLPLKILVGCRLVGWTERYSDQRASFPFQTFPFQLFFKAFEVSVLCGENTDFTTLKMQQRVFNREKRF